MEKDHRLLILASDAEDYLQFIVEAALPHLETAVSRDASGTNQELKECDILLGSPDLLVTALPHARQLKWVQSTWAGITPLLAAGLRRDYLLTGVKGVFGPLMAEYVLCHLLLHERKSLQRFADQQAGIWAAEPPGTLRGKRLGIMGLGSIGRQIATMVAPFGMKTVGFSRSRASCPGVDHCYLPGELLEFVRHLDYLVAVLPDTPETDGLINAEVLAAMRASAVLINVGRGNVVDEPALARALNEKTIGGAVLDVFGQEPLPAEHPFWHTPRTILTFHTAALSSAELVAPIFIDNYQRYCSGKPLQYVIDFARGY